MAEQDTIKEFLVALGFKTDEAGQKKFSNAIGLATAKFTALASLAEKAVESVVDNVKHFFSELEQFYFQAGETNSTVAGMKSLSLAAEHVGLSGEQALGALEGLATFIRHNPAGEGFLRGFGVQTRDANGQLLKTEELLLGVSRQLGKMPQYRANLYGQVLGLDEKTMMRMRSGEFEKEYRKTLSLFGGNDLKHAAEQWHDLTEMMRHGEEQLEVMGIKFFSSFLDDLDKPGIGKDFKELLSSVLELSEKISIALGPTLKKGLGAAIELADFLANSLRIIFDLVQGDVNKASTDAERIKSSADSFVDKLVHFIAPLASSMTGNLGPGAADQVSAFLRGAPLGDMNTSSKSSTLNQRTTINVVGGDPVATASAVASHQERVNAAGVRNLAKGTP